MPLKIRCPHCFRVLVAADETAGQTKLCPACGQMFNVPIPPRIVREPAAAPADTAPRCPRCHREVAPAATHCPRCHTDLATGKRLPLRQRLRLFSWVFWLLVGGAGVAGIVLVLVVIQLARIYTQPATTPFAPTPPRALPTADLAQRLLSAADDAQRAAALAGLGGVELRAASDVARALATSLDSNTSNPALRWNQIAAIELLARAGHASPQALAEGLDALYRCSVRPELRPAALRARAILGDMTVAEELADLWLDVLQRLCLFMRVTRVGHSAEQPASRLALQQVAADQARCADGLRALLANPDCRVLEYLVSAYWSSWQWLGQGRGDRLADELFDLARPGDQRLEFHPEDVRQPRDLLKAIATQAAPATRAAAGLILEQRGPQYKTLCRTIAETLGGLLGDCDAADQQRLTWAIGQLRGKLFAGVARTDPREVSADEIAAAMRWATPRAPATLRSSYPEPPVLTRRIVTVARQLERDLLAEMQQGWDQVGPALERWQAAGLGCTPRIAAQINPGQRRPNYPALAAAFAIIAQANEQALRPQLELWHEATDQPAWLRALAYTVLGSLDAQRGDWPSKWPVGLDLGDTRLFDAGRPGWDIFGRVLIAGGPAMLERLRNARATALSPETTARLLEAAHAAAPPS
jgi:phage FluMu protein Com